MAIHDRNTGRGSAVAPDALRAGARLTPTIDTIADTLGQYEDGPSFQAAIDLVWRYQLAGLKSLMAPKH
ncbi:hypothetical protein IB265_16270 [Ensifer sp. ENS10]|uniref:hypothetical protein n=1 Tax=Sinorhizobium/Ensifer group TaxID=227292 RepID=UPI000AD032FC|nr:MULTISPECIES: hypothetical protein [Sinorhizobium/Ensifer group]MBD9508339.1 hypothetical protein [Ensifer sp. ENS10]